MTDKMTDESIDFCGPIRLLPYAHRPWVNDALGDPRDTHRHVESWFERLFGKPCLLTPDGRTGLSIILDTLAVDCHDEVYVTTTFDTPNVSSCVTCTIFNHCKPARVLTPHTRAILVIHEFGVPHPRLAELAQEARRRGIPLIEDCAHTIDSRIERGRGAGRHGQQAASGTDQAMRHGALDRNAALGGVGSVGDFAIASLPKVFPVATGGIVAGDVTAPVPTRAEAHRLTKLRHDVTPLLDHVPTYRVRKREHFHRLAEAFRDIGLSPLHQPGEPVQPGQPVHHSQPTQLDESITPSFHFPLVTDRCDALMSAMGRADIECGRWHGTNVVVLPMHQLLTDTQLRRVIEVVRSVHGVISATKPRSGIESAPEPSCAALSATVLSATALPATALSGAAPSHEHEDRRNNPRRDRKGAGTPMCRGATSHEH